MYEIHYTSEFISAAKRCKRQGKNLQELWDVVAMLAESGTLPDAFHPHQLRDEFVECWECHIDEDWLLIWRKYESKLVLVLTNTGTHDELFRKQSKILFSGDGSIL